MGVVVAASHTANATAPHTASTAAQAPVRLGTAANFAVLSGNAITGTGPTLVTGDLGLSPGTAVTGFPPGVVNGAVHAADAAAARAQSDLAAAYDDAAARTPATTVPTQLGGTTLTPGVYTSAAGTFQITGNLTLDGQGDPDAVFVLQTASTLVTAADSTVTLTGGAQAYNVFWQVGSSATLGTGSRLAGNVLALTSITLNTGARVNGRVLARNGAVTLDTNTVTRAARPQLCGDTTTTTTVASSCVLGEAGPFTLTATVNSAAGILPTGQVTFHTDGATLGTAQLDAAGHATLTVTGLSEGGHRIIASFPGTAELKPSVSAVVVQRVGPDGRCPAEGCW